MSSWRYFGSKRKEEFESDLTPKELLDRLYDYQEVFGEEFGIKELLMLEDIRSKALIAEAINDAPEFLFDQLGLMQNDCGVGTITGALSDLADAVQQIADNQ